MKIKEPWIKTLGYARARCKDKGKKYLSRGIRCFLTPEQIKELWFRDNASAMKKPSVDRIDNDGDYTIANCRFIELKLNQSRGGKIGGPIGARVCNRYIKRPWSKGIKIPVMQYKLNGDFVKTWESVTDIQEVLGIDRSSISSCIHGRRKTCRDYIWKH